MTALESLRQRIDAADDTLLDALARRMELVDGVIKEKQEKGIPILDSGRERSILERIAEKANDRGLDPKLAERVLREIICHSREFQARRMQEQFAPQGSKVESVAYQGGEGAYSWVIAGQHFGDVQRVGCKSFADAIYRLEMEDVDRAILPIQNSIAGSIHDVYKLLSQSGLHVVGEDALRIEHCLIGLAGAREEEMERVLSHPVALRQCQNYLSGLDGVSVQSFVDTGMAVGKIAADNDPRQMAIAAAQAAQFHGLEVIRDGISDYPENFTRFWIVSRAPIKVDLQVPARTSLLLVTDHREGALVECLSVLAENGVNMTKLESRPRQGNQLEFQFYIDLEGNIQEARVVNTLEALRAKALFVRVLGCYPKRGH